MTYRKALDVRTWLDNTEYDLLSRPEVLHYDLFAYRDIAGGYWFAVEVRAGGIGKLAQSLFRWNGVALEPVTATPALEPVTWGDAQHVLRRVHGALLACCAALPGYKVISRHCHYLRALDCDPWPRGTVNTFSYAGRVGGKPGAARERTRRARQAVPGDVGGVLPDVL